MKLHTSSILSAKCSVTFLGLTAKLDWLPDLPRGQHEPRGPEGKSEEARKESFSACRQGAPVLPPRPLTRGPGQWQAANCGGVCARDQDCQRCWDLKGKLQNFLKAQQPQPCNGPQRGSPRGPLAPLLCSDHSGFLERLQLENSHATLPGTWRGRCVWNRCVTTPPLMLHVTRSSFCSCVLFLEACPSAKNSSPHGEGGRRMWSGAGLCGSNPNRIGFTSASRGGEMHVYQFFVSLVT